MFTSEKQIIQVLEVGYPCKNLPSGSHDRRVLQERIRCAGSRLPALCLGLPANFSTIAQDYLYKMNEAIKSISPEPDRYLEELERLVREVDNLSDDDNRRGRDSVE